MEPPKFGFGDRVKQIVKPDTSQVRYGGQVHPGFTLHFAVVSFRPEGQLWVYRLVNMTTGAQCERVEELLEKEG